MVLKALDDIENRIAKLELIENPEIFITDEIALLKNKLETKDVEVV